MIVKNYVRVIDKGRDRNGRWIWCDIEAGEVEWRIMGVYGPNDSRGRTQVWKEVS